MGLRGFVGPGAHLGGDGLMLRLAYEPTPPQAAIHAALREHRHVVVAKGRRLGGTHAGVHELLRFVLATPDGVASWLSPTFGQSRHAWRELLRAVRQVDRQLLESVNRSELRIEMKNGAAVNFGSLQNPDFLRGAGLDLMLVDEAAYVPVETWTMVLAPMLLDRLGRALLIGSPRGKQGLLWWAWNQAGWCRLHFPSAANPRLSAQELVRMRAELPEDAARQELDGEFLDSAATVFRHLDRCVRGGFEAPKKGHRYVVGWDPAKSQDFSARVVLDQACLQVVHAERVRGVDYATQITDVLALARRYNGAPVVVDQTGVGAAVLDFMRSELGGRRRDDRMPREGGLPKRSTVAQGLTWTNSVKEDLVRGLQLRIERGQIGIPYEAFELLDELKAFEYQITSTGRVTFNAPSGGHDDLVAALMMASHAVHDEARWEADAVLQQIRRARHRHTPLPIFGGGGRPDAFVRHVHDRLDAAELHRRWELGAVTDDEFAALRDRELPFDGDYQGLLGSL